MIGKGLLLSVRLFFDRRMPITSKALPLIALGYFIFPIDLLPDATALGFIDDIGLSIGLLNAFVNSASPELLEEHLDKLSRNDRILGLLRRGEAAANLDIPRRHVGLIIIAIVIAIPVVCLLSVGSTLFFLSVFN